MSTEPPLAKAQPETERRGLWGKPAAPPPAPDVYDTAAERLSNRNPLTDVPAESVLPGLTNAAPPYQRLQTWNDMTETPTAPMSESGKPTNIAPTDEARRWPDSIATHQHRTFTAPTDDVARLNLSALSDARDLVNQQAEDPSLWATGPLVPPREQRLQAALRALHAAIEGNRELNREEHSDA